MEDRAAVFSSQPQAVEVYQAGAWWPGELLGWRHSADGSCQVSVRVVLGGVEETAWTDLSTLRLPEAPAAPRPERHLAMAPGPATASADECEQSLARHPSSRRGHAPATEAATAQLPVVRDLSVVPGGSPAGGRRRAPEQPVASTGGRRRAPEGDEVVAAPSATSGRHRAHGAKGRHGADTGLLPVVADGAPASRSAGRRAASSTAEHHWVLPSARPARSDDTVAAPGRKGWAPPAGLESERLTRPMRLSDHGPHARRPHVDGSRRGA